VPGIAWHLKEDFMCKNKDVFSDAAICYDCGQPMTVVRPGKYQCDNPSCHVFAKLLEENMFMENQIFCASVVDKEKKLFPNSFWENESYCSFRGVNNKGELVRVMSYKGSYYIVTPFSAEEFVGHKVIWYLIHTEDRFKRSGFYNELLDRYTDLLMKKSVSELMSGKVKIEI
jgi:hypothetical protein